MSAFLNDEELIQLKLKHTYEFSVCVKTIEKYKYEHDEPFEIIGWVKLSDVIYFNNTDNIITNPWESKKLYDDTYVSMIYTQNNPLGYGLSFMSSNLKYRHFSFEALEDRYRLIHRMKKVDIIDSNFMYSIRQTAKR